MTPPPILLLIPGDQYQVEITSSSFFFSLEPDKIVTGRSFGQIGVGLVSIEVTRWYSACRAVVTFLHRGLPFSIGWFPSSLAAEKVLQLP